MNNKQLRTILIIGGVVVLLGLGAYIFYPRGMAEPDGGTPEAAESQVRKVADDFGRALKNVSRQAPQDDLEDSIRTNYSPYLSPRLLEAWTNDTSQVLGRQVSSPWPDRIQIDAVTKENDAEYRVEGEIIEVTSATDILSGGVAGRRDLTLTVRNIDGRWLIDGAEAGEYRADTGDWPAYENREYGFRVRYPRNLGTSYISLAVSPSPSITVTPGSLQCDTATTTATVSRKQIDGRDFCVTSRSEGAAGSTYIEYTYATPQDGNVIAGNFTLRYPQCANYEEAERRQCEAERQDFNLDSLVGQVAGSYERISQ